MLQKCGRCGSVRGTKTHENEGMMIMVCASCLQEMVKFLDLLYLKRDMATMLKDEKDYVICICGKQEMSSEVWEVPEGLEKQVLAYQTLKGEVQVGLCPECKTLLRKVE